MSVDPDRPCIHVCLLPGADPALYRWVEIGAEEEGLPTRLVTSEGADLAAQAFHAAQSSRLSIGVAISPQAVALHEQHMPVERPVLTFTFADNAAFLCRTMGANAARMVVHHPLMIDLDPAPPVPFRKPAAAPARPDGAGAAQAVELEFDPAQLSQIVSVVVRKMLERGV
ncbi:MAG: glycerol dehydratase reactivase beta/small subunit family protein [Chloroflexota bacterium]